MLFILQATCFAFSVKVNDVQAESKTTFNDAKDVPASTNATINLIAAKGKGESNANAKYYLYISLVANNDKVEKVYSFAKNPVKLTFTKNGVNKTLTFKTEKGNVNTVPDWNYLQFSKLLIKEVRDELLGISDLQIMLPLANGSYKTLKCPKTVTDGWDYVLTVNLEELEKNAK